LLYTIAALALLAPHVLGVATPAALEGSYVAKTLNGRTLPAELRLPATEGDFRLFKLEQAVLRLDGRGSFTLYFRYYHQLVRRGTKPVRTPVMSESEVGTYTINKNRITLVPAKKKTSRASHKTILATLSGDEIKASYVLQSGSTQERVTLVLARDASYW
jgi:hypothetical protein